MMNNRISVNEPGFEISLFSTHTLDNGNTEITLPRLIDSQFISNIDFTFSGTVDHSTKIPPADMLRSSAVQSFLRYLTIARLPLNRDHLGIIDISKVILDDHASGVPKVSVTPSCRYGFHTDAHVLSIHLAYNWKSLSRSSAGLTIFSPQMLLPLLPALNKLVCRLFSNHVVGRYPWLFGPLRTKLSLEHQWFPSLVRSLLAIMRRSENQEFRNKTQALVKVEDPTFSMWIETEYYLQKIQSQVSVYKQVTDNTYGCPSSQSIPRAERSDKDTLILALELVLRITARSPPFKGACHPVTTSLIDDALDLPELAPNEDVSSDMLFWDDFLLPDSTQLPEEDNIWSGDLEEDINDSDLAFQVDPAEVAEDIISNNRSSWDSGDDDKDNDELMSYVSEPLESVSCTWMPYLSRGIPDENFIALDHNLEAPDIGIFDEGEDSLLLVFD